LLVSSTSTDRQEQATQAQADRPIMIPSVKAILGVSSAEIWTPKPKVNP
jgi:hypothetical protein